MNNIDILEEKLKQWEPYKNTKWASGSIEEQIAKENQAISNLIAENKELKEENEGLKTKLDTLIEKYKELKKDKEEISEEQMKQFYKDAQKALKEYRETQNKVAKLEEENKELKEKIKEINEEYNAEQKYEMENTIPKSKVKEVIEEVEQWGLYNMKIPKLSTLDERLGAKIGIKYVLQSLLRKE